MPFARLTLIPQPKPYMAERLTTGITDLIARDLGKKRHLTAVLVDTPDVSRWTIGSDKRPSAAHLEI